MALVPCPDCHALVPAAAPACPHCGRPRPGDAADAGDATLLHPAPAAPASTASASTAPAPAAPASAAPGYDAPPGQAGYGAPPPAGYGAPAAGTGVDRRLALGGAGAGLLVLGVFSPVVLIPVVGGLSLIQYREWAALVLLLLAVASGVMALVGRYELLGWTGAVSLAGTLSLFGWLLWQMADARRQLRESGDPDSEATAQLVGLLIKFDWGWLPLLVGSVLLIAASRARPGPFDFRSL